MMVRYQRLAGIVGYNSFGGLRPIRPFSKREQALHRVSYKARPEGKQMKFLFAGWFDGLDLAGVPSTRTDLASPSERPGSTGNVARGNTSRKQSLHLGDARVPRDGRSRQHLANELWPTSPKRFSVQSDYREGLPLVGQVTERGAA